MKPRDEVLRAVFAEMVGDALTRDREHHERQFNHYDGLGFHTDDELAQMYGTLNVVLLHLRMLSELGSP